VLANLEQRFQEAVQAFWDARDRQQQKQIQGGKIDAGTRGAVTGGTQMGALEILLTDVLVSAGLLRSDIRARTALELPGYYRPEKRWDQLVVSDDQLVMAVEFKSQVGSFGKNFNNRTEEAIGNAEDIWTAYREGRFGRYRAPMLGFFFLLEECAEVHAPIGIAEPYFKVDPVFKDASYAKRYEILFERLVLERKYTSTCLALATKANPTTVNFPAQALNFRQFAAAADAHAKAFVNSRLCGMDATEFDDGGVMARAVERPVRLGLGLVGVVGHFEDGDVVPAHLGFPLISVAFADSARDLVGCCRGAGRAAG
jgi:hypothetical protein